MKDLRASIDPFSEFGETRMKLIFHSPLREPHLEALIKDRSFTENRARILKEVREETWNQ